MTHRLILNNEAFVTRITSFIWAVLLLFPLLTLAEYCNNRFLFHLLLFITGWLSWAYTEYFFHRFIMHEGNQKKGLGKLMNHNHHHIDPEDIRLNRFHRYLMSGGSIAIAVFSIIANNYLTLFSGYFIGFTIYSFMHLILHYKWSRRLFPSLHKFHISHHCKHADKCFGVVITLWDHLFGTVPVKHTAISERIKEFYYKKKI